MHIKKKLAQKGQTNPNVLVFYGCNNKYHTCSNLKHTVAVAFFHSSGRQKWVKSEVWAELSSA